MKRRKRRVLIKPTCRFDNSRVTLMIIKLKVEIRLSKKTAFMLVSLALLAAKIVLLFI